MSLNEFVKRRVKQLVESEPDRYWTWHKIHDLLWNQLEVDTTDMPYEEYKAKRTARRANWTRAELRAFLVYEPFDRIRVTDRYTAAPGFRRSRVRTTYKWKGHWKESSEEE